MLLWHVTKLELCETDSGQQGCAQGQENNLSTFQTNKSLCTCCYGRPNCSHHYPERSDGRFALPIIQCWAIAEPPISESAHGHWKGPVSAGDSMVARTKSWVLIDKNCKQIVLRSTCPSIHYWKDGSFSRQKMPWAVLISKTGRVGREDGNDAMKDQSTTVSCFHTTRPDDPI